MFFYEVVCLPFISVVPTISASYSDYYNFSSIEADVLSYFLSTLTYSIEIIGTSFGILGLHDIGEILSRTWWSFLFSFVPAIWDYSISSSISESWSTFPITQDEAWALVLLDLLRKLKPIPLVLFLHIFFLWLMEKSPKWHAIFSVRCYCFSYCFIFIFQNKLN